jgi:glycosyltransferase involved in cell wall biosynthesis
MNLLKRKVSVIISVLNAKNNLENCIISILNQDYKDFELIIIDGGSIDGTIQILENYSNKLSFWISEKDTGIYNAWNKALLRASGEWICFIGSDDILLPNSLTKFIAQANYPEVNFVSSRVMVVDDVGEELGPIGKSWNFQNLSYGSGVVHCGALHHHTLFDKYGFFNDDYKIAGDFEFLVRVGKDIKSNFLNEITVNMCNSGLSNKNTNEVIFETSNILYLDSNFGKLYGVKYFFSAHIRSFIRELIFIFPFGKKLFRFRNK